MTKSLNPSKEEFSSRIADPNNILNKSILNTGPEQLPPIFQAQIANLTWVDSRVSNTIADSDSSGYLSFSFSEFQFGGASNHLPEQSNGSDSDKPYTSIHAGPFYKYNVLVNDSNKLPPHFDDYLFVSDWETRRLDIAKFKIEDGEILLDTIVDMNTTLQSSSFSQLIDMKISPNGKLFLVGREGDLRIIDYVGTECIITNEVCTDPYRLVNGMCVLQEEEVTSVSSELSSSVVSNVGLTSQSLNLAKNGNYHLKLYNSLGKVVQELSLTKAGTYSYKSLFSKASPNLYFLKVSQQGFDDVVQKIPLI